MDRVRARLRERQSMPVPMSVAASLVYFELRHTAASNGDALDRALNDAALALAHIADVYYENEAGHVLRIPDEALRNGQFDAGAQIYRTLAGQTFKALCMRRIDVMYAMEVLRKASHAIGIANQSAAFDSAKAKPVIDP